MSNSPRVVCNVEGIIASIQQVGDRATKGISDVMRDYGELIVHQAKLNAPHDTGSLEGAIQAEYMRNGINRRLIVKIWVDPNTPYIDPNPRHKRGNKTVGDYAMLMEQYLTPHGDGGWHAQEGTTGKGPQAGGKFLERAVDQYRDALLQRAENIVRRAIT